ncbi:PREDICTED: uncharacterized protein LOC107171243 [Diuraphis noxia]|uniref:uncharacterized protein LOC107171243 n=1 Tax=Diuraphis noxia TaxID=143948 RepID=UPI0007636200|nr:PREDICTED: uncharacterized protein LOC107171243 [Diuraphis noxia]
MSPIKTSYGYWFNIGRYSFDYHAYNDALKPAKLQQHLHTAHPTLKDQPPEFFEGQFKSLKNMKLGPSWSSVALSQDAEEQLLGKIKSSSYFALQCDETTDIAQ